MDLFEILFVVTLWWAIVASVLAGVRKDQLKAWERHYRYQKQRESQ